MKKLLFLLFTFFLHFHLKAQSYDCTFKPPAITMHFGTGIIHNINTSEPYAYRRVPGSCPTDGHYAYISYTSECFRGDWHTLHEDHTPGDADGNMLLVNASPYSGTLLTTTISGLKGGTPYEFSVWMMNVCKISEKCPFPLLPDITIRLQTPDGKTVMQIGVGELARRLAPQWTQYKAIFTTPPSVTPLTLVMDDNAPGGCGNDFAVDDISFRECVKRKPVVTTAPKAAPPVVAKKQPVTTNKPMTPNKPVLPNKPADKPVAKKATPPAPVKKPVKTSQVTRPQTDTPLQAAPVIKPKRPIFSAPPPILTARTNQLIKLIEAEEGEINFRLYDNGEIDGDTVTIYHNNVLLVSHARLSEKPISFRIAIDASNPHHELVMVAENLGSIPPNTSLMVVTAGSKRYEVYISSTEQKNAKVVIDLKE